jgi:hypothetical protein
MKLKEQKNGTLLSTTRQFFKKGPRIKLLVILSAVMIVLVTVSLVSMYTAIVIYQAGKVGSLNNRLHDGMVSKLSFIPNYFKGVSANPETFAIDIKFKDLEKLRFNRDKALSYGHIQPEFKEEEVPAKLTHNGETYKIKMRITGGSIRHVADAEKWSFRIKIRGEETVLRMKEFNLLYPRSRGYLSDWIGHQLQKKLGLIGLRMTFVDVTLNGNSLGIYCLEENYDKRLVEDNRLREGLVFRWSETPQIYNKKKSLNDPAFKEKAVVLNRLFQAFMVGDVGVGQVFDLPKMAKFFAINDLMNGGIHGMDFGNTRFYFNPVTNLIEPIGREWDMSMYKYKSYLQNNIALSIDHLKKFNYYPYYRKFFADKNFMELYLHELGVMSKKSFLDDFFEEIAEDMEELTSVIYRDNPFYVFPKEFFYNNQIFIRNKIYPKQALVSYYNETSDNHLQVSIRNLQGLPVLIRSLILNDSITISPAEEIILPSKPNSGLDHQQIEFPIPKGYAIDVTETDKLEIEYNILGLDLIYNNEIFPWPYAEVKSFSKNFTRKKTNIYKAHFLDINESEKTITFKSGIHGIKEDLIIPGGYKVIAKDNCGIDLLNSTTIISYSPIFFYGSQKSPINIISTDTTGKGLLILNTKERSVLDNVHFNNLSNPSSFGWKLTGAVTFYEADISITNCLFSDNRQGDDYLNIIRSSYLIDNCIFRNVNADAFDSDFGLGMVVNTTFENCNNDAIDISGTNLEVKRVLMDNIGDKGLSAGENSQMNVHKIKIVNSEIAVCSKDMSAIIIDDAMLENNKIAFTAYQKKSEFGQGTITATNIEMKNISVPYLIETQSQLSIDGENKESNNERVKDLLYGVKYGKSSK